jgi:mannobiose 2-epimerase
MEKLQQIEVPPTKADLADVAKRLKRLLYENIVPAWYPNSIDRLWGGYWVDRNVTGKKLRRTNKMVVTQARMVWFFSRLARFSPDGDIYSNAAKTGIQFLSGRMRDRKNGGYNIEVSPSGFRAKSSQKHLYCQTIALMALSEYARVTRDGPARSSSVELFQTIEDRAYDKENPGYREIFQNDWELLPEHEMGFMWLASGWKTLNTHMHLIEAYTTYLALENDELAKERILEVVNIIRLLAARTKSGALRDIFMLDWKPHNGAQFDRVSYGHNLELVWLFVDACRMINEPLEADISWFENVFDYSFGHGFDGDKGGFFESGPVAHRADKLDKIWWVQAEALVSALTMYRLTNRRKYWDCFLKTLSWIERYQADWGAGDWHNCITIEGSPRGLKAGPWKAAYHNGRAMIECLERLPS